MAARRLCSEYVDPSGISTLVAWRLIALDKCPGVRPIGVGETVRRVIGKAIATTISNDIQEAAGPLQVCAGRLSGCEAAVHAMHQVYQSSSTEAVILVYRCLQCVQLAEPRDCFTKHPTSLSSFSENPC